jgi:hypothetical protein
MFSCFCVEQMEYIEVMAANDVFIFYNIIIIDIGRGDV